MFKKLLLVGLIAFGVSAVYQGRQVAPDAIEKVASFFNRTREVSMEKKFAQLRQEVNQLDREVEKVKTELATEIVEVKGLNEATGTLRAKVDADRLALLANGKAIETATTKVSYGQVQLTVAEAKVKLEGQVATHERTKTRLAMMERTLGNREKNRDALQQTLDAMTTKKVEMLAEIDAAQAEYQLLKLAQAESKHQTDDSKLAHVKARLRELQKSIEIEKTKLALTPATMGEPAPEAKAKSVAEILAPVTGKVEKVEAEKIGEVN